MSNLFTLITFAKDFYKNNTISVLYNYSNAGFEKNNGKDNEIPLFRFLKVSGSFLK